LRGALLKRFEPRSLVNPRKRGASRLAPATRNDFRKLLRQARLAGLRIWKPFRETRTSLSNVKIRI
jgi:hypothetical protein